MCRRGHRGSGPSSTSTPAAVAVDQQVDGPLGGASSPCATAGSSNWYFATGATLINASVGLSLLNPYPTDAVVDLSFTTDQGVEMPQQFQGLVVPADGLLPVNLGDHLRRRQLHRHHGDGSIGAPGGLEDRRRYSPHRRVRPCSGRLPAPTRWPIRPPPSPV